MAEPESVSAAKRAARLERREAALALRPSLSPAAPAPDRLRIATWNLNSLRRRLPAVERFLERVDPDVVCLQETKAASLSDAATAMFEQHGYHAAHVGAGSYNGSMSTWLGGVLERDGSRGGRSASATCATSACAST